MDINLHGIANMKLNKEAAGRFIKAAISTNQEESSRSSQSKKKREIINVYSSSEDEEKTKPAKKKGRVMMDPFSGKISKEAIITKQSLINV